MKPESPNVQCMFWCQVTINSGNSFCLACIIFFVLRNVGGCIDNLSLILSAPSDSCVPYVLKHKIVNVTYHPGVIFCFTWRMLWSTMETLASSLVVNIYKSNILLI